MNITYFAKAFTEKPTTGAVVYNDKNKAYEHNVKSLKDIVEIYNHGYAFRLSKNETNTQIIILDIDDCIEHTKESIQKYINANNLQWYCDNSASMKDTKCKVFVWLDKEIEATKDNLEKETSRILNILKSNNEYYCNKLEVDKHQINNPKQLTYGLPRNKAFVDSEYNGLPCFEDDIATIWITNKTQQINDYCRILPLLEEFRYDDTVSDYIDIPLNKYEFYKFLCNYRSDLFHDGVGFVNQLITTFNTYYNNNGKCCIKKFTDNHRHWVADNLTTIIALNTVILRLYYNMNVTVYDAMQTLSKWIHFTFELKDNKHWLNKDGYYKKYQDKMLKAIESILNDCDWSEYNNDYLKEYITMHNNWAEQCICSYKPQDKVLRYARQDFKLNIMPKIDNLFTYNYEMLADLVDYYYPDVDQYVKASIIDLAIDFIKKDNRSSFFGHRTDKGCKHIMTKTRCDKGKCLEDYDIVDNTVTIPRNKVTNAIKLYCSRHSIKIIRI